VETASIRTPSNAMDVDDQEEAEAKVEESENVLSSVDKTSLYADVGAADDDVDVDGSGKAGGSPEPASKKRKVTNSREEQGEQEATLALPSDSAFAAVE
jgi:hypothetical protein